MFPLDCRPLRELHKYTPSLFPSENYDSLQLNDVHIHIWIHVNANVWFDQERKWLSLYFLNKKEKKNDEWHKEFLTYFIFLETRNINIYFINKSHHILLWIIVFTKLLLFIPTHHFYEWTMINARPLPSNRNNRTKHVFSSIDLGALHNPIPNLAEITVNVTHYRP